jgi:hypothetical protein
MVFPQEVAIFDFSADFPKEFPSFLGRIGNFASVFVDFWGEIPMIEEKLVIFRCFFIRI